MVRISKRRNGKGKRFAGDSVASSSSFFLGGGRGSFMKTGTWMGFEKGFLTFAPFKTGGCAKSLAFSKPRPTGKRNTRAFISDIYVHISFKLLSLFAGTVSSYGKFRNYDQIPSSTFCPDIKIAPDYWIQLFSRLGLHFLTCFLLSIYMFLNEINIILQ